MLLEMKGISKRFGKVQALKNVDLSLDKNEVLGLIGDNGAGKSTLMKILSGAYIADKGEIFIDGKKVDIKQPADAQREGIYMVYQDLALAWNIDTPGNVFLGREFKRSLWKIFPVIDRNKMREQAERLLDKLGIEVPNIDEKVSALSGGQQQAVSIARIIWGSPRIVILDEPFANLGVSEKKKVHALITALKKRGGLGIIMIDHSFENIFAVVDRVLVLRNGEKVGDKRIEDTTPNELTSLMVGAEIAETVRKIRQGTH